VAVTGHDLLAAVGVEDEAGTAALTAAADDLRALRLRL
jgi:hypothetical protein